MKVESPGSSVEMIPDVIKGLLAKLEKKVSQRDFFLEEGETEEDVLRRVELLRNVLLKLPYVAPDILSVYREVLSGFEISPERTGKLSLVIVGGRVHGESQLKTWSDIDMVITAEKPFLNGRRIFISKEVDELLPEPLYMYSPLLKQMVERFKAEILPKLGTLVGKNIQDEGVLEIKDFGHQSVDTVQDAVVICSE